ncbi:MAG: putative membrane protein [Luteibaculaceae bacterium]|jgi:putative membrane protein
MYIKKNYSFLMTFNWSKWPFIFGLLYAYAILGICHWTQWQISLPWQPISMVGIAVAFYLGFKNNSSYDRTWEARKLWGGIVNHSRGFGSSVLAFIDGNDKKLHQKKLIYRHVAWLTSLRYQLRLSKEWEHKKDRLNNLYSPMVCEQYKEKLCAKLRVLLDKEELDELISKSNWATQLLANQSKHLQELKNAGVFDDFRHMEMKGQIQELYNMQGGAERIKNFPFPRQYASTALWFTWVFAALVPFGLLEAFPIAQHGWLSLAPFFSALLTWVFFLMEKIGDYSENPFEGTYNDVPITTIANGIEIDLREMIQDTDIPEALKAQNGFLM